MTARTPEEILDALVEDGTMPTVAEVSELCALARAAHQLEATLEALQGALVAVGYRIIDTTSDDDDGQVTLQIVRAGEDDT